jgi:hypothetical protein
LLEPATKVVKAPPPYSALVPPPPFSVTFAAASAAACWERATERATPVAHLLFGVGTT